jgi:hypothetical protein
MNTVYRDASGQVVWVFSKCVYEGVEHAAEWTGLNKHCSAIPEGAMSYIDNLHDLYLHPDAECNEFGHYKSMEWMDQPGWHRAEVHYRGWIPLLESGDQEHQPSRWAREMYAKLDVEKVEYSRYPSEAESLGPLFQLSEEGRDLIKSDLLHWRTMMDELRLSPLYHEATYTPALFNIAVVDLPCTSEDFVHHMVASARRSILETMGFINWWTSSVPGWSVGLDHTIVQEIWDQNLLGA